ncbi:MAG: hypothetical protein FJ291_13595 [Planctomycetes bacterium]|nr:hypothetical protein [Planctomycetota bacterium]
MTPIRMARASAWAAFHFFVLSCASGGGVEVLSSFEPGGPDLVKGEGKRVKEHATDGEHAFRVESDGTGYPGLEIAAPAALAKFRDFVLFKVDVFNPQDQAVNCGARMDDAASKDYGSRYNDDNLVVPPGKSTLELNLTGLRKSNARNFSQRLKLDLGSLKLVRLWIAPVGKPLTLFFDNVRLEGSGLPKVEGLVALDFGPAGAPVYPGFEACSDQHVWDDQRGWGWVGSDYATIAYTPDALTGDCVGGREFRLKLPNGPYEVHLCWDMFGLWHTLPSFTWRKLLINGKEAISETRTGADFLAKLYYRHEDDEDLPGQDLWEKYIASYQTVHRFKVEVSDSLLRIEPQADDKSGRGLCFLVVCPEAAAEAGRKFMDTLGALRKAKFNAGMVVSVPKPGHPHPPLSPREREDEEPKPTDAEKARGFIHFVAHTEDDVAVTARPPKDAAMAIAIEAARGERQAAQVCLFPLAEASDLTVARTALRGPAGAEIPASAIQVRKVRNFLKRAGSSRAGNLLPYILQDFRPLDLRPGVTRGLWLTISVPESAAPGKYTGELQVGTAAIPIELTVHPFALDRVTDITMSVTGSTAGTFNARHPDLNARWWAEAERVMRNQAEHGMNAVTGGPSAVLKGVKDGKAEIDYAAMDSWMALAVKHGLTMPGDSYQGLDVAGVPHDHSQNAVARCEAAARERFGVSYEELLRIVYADVERHAKEKGWPPRVYYFLDEPRPEYRNVESCGELIRLRTRACPNTLFSGYYSTGAGRDVYFQTMPVSIAHVNPRALELVKGAGKRLWDYSGSRVRHDIGRWAFVAARAGMSGFLRNGYMYVCSMPYFDYSDDEASWSVVYPSKKGLNDTVGWERTAQGVNDYRYLLTCERLIAKARAAGKGAAEAEAAAAFLKAALQPIAIEDKASARLSPAQYDAFRRAIAAHIAALSAK